MKDRFEKDIKDIFNQHEEAVNQDLLWAGIEAGIVEKKDRKYIWFIVPILLLAVVSWSYFLWPTDKSGSVSDVVEYHRDLQDDKLAETTKSEDLTVISESHQSSIKRSAGSENQLKESRESESEIKTKVVKLIDDSKGGLKKSETVDRKFNTKASDELVFQGDVEHAVAINRSSASPNTDEKDERGDQADDRFSMAELTTKITINQSPQVENKEEVTGVLPEETATTDKQLNGRYVETPTKLALYAQAIAYEKEQITFDSQPLMNYNFRDQNPNPSTPEKKSSKNVKKHGVLLYGGFALGNKNYITETDFGQEVKTMEQIEAGFSIVAYSRKALSLSTGARYSLLTDKFAWNGNYAGSENTNYLQEIVIYENNEIEENYVDEEIETTITREILIFPKRHIVSVPVTLSYSLPIKSVDLYTSYLFSYQFASKEFLFDDKGAPKKHQISGSWLNPNFEIGLAYSYQYNSSKSLVFSPYYHFTGYRLGTSLHSARHNNHHFGLKLGFGF